MSLVEAIVKELTKILSGETKQIKEAETQLEALRTKNDFLNTLCSIPQIPGISSNSIMMQARLPK